MPEKVTLKGPGIGCWSFHLCLPGGLFDLTRNAQDPLNQHLGFFRFRTWGLRWGFRVQGLWFRVYGCTKQIALQMSRMRVPRCNNIGSSLRPSLLPKALSYDPTPRKAMLQQQAMMQAWRAPPPHPDSSFKEPKAPPPPPKKKKKKQPL